MTKIKIPLGVDSYQSESKPFSARRCVNMFARVLSATGLNKYALFPTPGIVPIGSVAGAGSRGAIVVNGSFYVIIDTSLYQVSVSGVFVRKGTVQGVKRVSLATNGIKLAIVADGGVAYQYDTSVDSFQEVTDSNYPKLTQVAFKDGYFVGPAASGKVWHVSALNDFLTWDALDYASAELDPDQIVAITPSYNEVVVFGESSAEVFRPRLQTGSYLKFPFQRVEGASYTIGAMSRDAIVQRDGVIYLLGAGDNTLPGIYRIAVGGAPTRISTPGIDRFIQEYSLTELQNAFGFTHHSFVGFTFRSINRNSRTFVFNIDASSAFKAPVWEERQTGATITNWRVASVNAYNNALWVTDLYSGKVGRLDNETYTEYDTAVLREFITVPVTTGGPYQVSKITLYSDMGHASADVTLDYSDDGARTWSFSRQGSLGRLGEYFNSVVWRRMGRVTYGRVWRFRSFSEKKVIFLGLQMEATK